MKKIFLPLFLFAFSIGMAFGQPDTLLVPFDFGGSPFGSLQNFVTGDTTATGERNNPERYYKLEKDKIYFLDGTFLTDFDLRLIADEAEEGEKPPIVASTAGADGVIQLVQFKMLGDGYIKNIIFQMTPPTSDGESSACFFLSGEDKNYEFDNVMIEWGLWTGMVTDVPVNKVVIRNCYFKNLQHKTNIWNGRGFGFFQENPADTVIMQNNTFFNNNSFAFFADISSIPPDYLLFDHNSIVNSIKFPIHSFWLPNAVVTNNLFYNAHSFGESNQDVVGQDPDGLKYGIINPSPIPSDLLEYYDMAEGDRSYTVTNNGFFYENEIEVYWQSYGLGPTPWMNQRVIDMFGNDAMYPNMGNEDPVAGNPTFVNSGEGMTTMIEWMQNNRDLMGNTYWGWDPDGDKFAVQWPIVEDLSYSNADLIYAAQDNYPLGDLNWWPELLPQWEEGIVLVGTQDVPSYQIDQIKVSPSPASDQMTINYELLEKNDVRIVVYSVKGSWVKTLFDGEQSQGTHAVDWQIDSSLPSGVYLIRISDGIGSFTKKVIVQK